MIIDEYINYCNKYVEEYGEKTIILMEVGSFYELYGIDNDRCRQGADIYTIATLLNIQVSRKNKNILDNDRNNPLMAGFPSFALTKFIDILITNKYVIVLVEQKMEDYSSVPTRNVTEIITPATYNNNLQDTQSNSFVTIYMDNAQDRRTLKKFMVVGLTVFDSSTGKITLHELKNEVYDNLVLYEQIVSFVLKYNPKEVCLCSIDILDTDNVNEVIQSLQILNNNYKLNNNIGKVSSQFRSIHFQKEILERIYKSKFENKDSMLNVFEMLNIENNFLANIAFTYTLYYIHKLSPMYVNHIYSPTNENTEHEKLTLANDSIAQLNIYDNTNDHTLMKILNNCKTPMGKRYFSFRLLNPMTNTDSIIESYNNITSFIQYGHDKIEFKNIYDIERLVHKMSTAKITPCEIANIVTTLENIQCILYEHKSFMTKVFKIDITTMITKCIESFKKCFHVEELHKYNVSTTMGYHVYNENYCNCGICSFCTLCDKVQEETDIQQFFEKLLCNLNQEHSSHLGNNSCFKLEYNDRDGYHYSITAKRFEQIKNKISTFTHRYNSNKSVVKLFNDECKEKNDILFDLRQQLKKIHLTLYSTLVKDLFHKHNSDLYHITKHVELIDFYDTCAKNSVKMCLSCPIIENRENKSYIDIYGLRHPIVEKINTGVQYISNDVNLNQSGMILYGINSSGKSCLMKSIGIAIILAQSGMFVSAKKMMYYPYTTLHTRIVNNDNLYKNQSTFVLEMNELRNILKQTHERSIVIGDELCSGTESISAISIVSAGIMFLTRNNTSFIFATHLQELNHIEEINSNDKIKIYHLQTRYDVDKKMIIYDRVLQPGYGEALYGLEVCKALDLDECFMRDAFLIRDKIDNKNGYPLLDIKQSKYNKEIYLDTCMVCANRKATEVHHIHEQRTSDQNGIILTEQIHKNAMCNLIPLCNECHNKIHHGNLHIHGYKDTTSGIKLQFEYTNNDKNQFNNIILEKISEWKNTLTNKAIIKKLKEEHNISLSVYKFNKILKGI